jgi:hypothetical protein
VIAFPRQASVWKRTRGFVLGVALALAAIVLVLGVTAYGGRLRGLAAAATASHADDARKATISIAAAAQPGKARALEGEVRAATGAPIANATVCISARERACCEVCVQTDVRGTFAFDAIEPGQFKLHASADQHKPSTRDLLLQASASEYPTVALELEPGGAKTSGKVVDALGGPIAGAMVMVTEAWQSASFGVGRTNGAGEFAVFGAEGPVKVSVDADGYAGASKEATAPASNITLVLAPAAGLAGTVVEQGTDQPVAAATVTISCANGFTASASSGSDGRFELEEVQPGACQLQAAGDHFRSDSISVALGIGERVDSLVVPVAAGASVKGQVLVDGSPCAAASVALSGPQELRIGADAQGNVHLGGVPPGKWDLHVECNGATPIREQLTLSADSAIERTWKLGRGFEVRGEVVAADGTGQGGVQIRIEDATGRRGSMCLSEQTGEFLCSGLEAGSYEARAMDQSGELGPSVPVVLSDGGVDGIRLELRPAGSVAVSVVAADGQPRDDLPVFATSSNGLELRAQPVGAGEFVLASLAPGDYQVFAGHPDSSASARVAVTAGTRSRATIRAASDAAIEGIVVDEQRNPVADAWVTAVSSAERGAATPVLSDAEGAFRITGLLSGSYDIKVTTGFGEAESRAVPTGSQAELRISEFASMGGTVMDDRHQPVESFSLSYAGTDGIGYEQDVSSASGQWFVDKLRPGTWLISIRSNAGHASQQVELAASQKLELQLLLQGSDSNPDL